MNLNVLIILPFLTAMFILFSKDLKQIRMVAFMGAALQLVLGGFLLYVYCDARAAGDTSQFLFEQSFAWYPSLNINYHIGVDGISIAMILLTASVVLAGVLVSWNESRMSKEFFLLLTFLALGAYGFFISLDLFTLFFFLELAVIPKYLLIGIWGSGKKEYSAMKLALMLMGGSALVLVGILGVYFYGGNSFDLVSVSQNFIPIEMQRIFFPLLFVGFGIFTAIFPFHTWVPDGHSSAPTAASMFLAGISMKLGGYGCLRVAMYLMPEAAHEYQPIIIVLSTIAIIYGAFATLMQTDLKYINAYSSVSHCGFVLLGIGMLNQTAINGAVMQMVSHGLMTALFFAAIGMLYTRTHTRMVSQLGGLLKVMPFISTVFVIAGLCSLGLPGFSGFVSEMTVFMGGWQNPEALYRIATILACASIVVTAVYILRATGSAIMGPITNNNYTLIKDATWNERLASIVLIAGIVLIGMAPFLLTDLIGSGVSEIMMRVGK
ncbi:MAG: NADH-quinone oxidoreductase subunit M [Chitinophagales bacterium]|jgi:NADH-quinone oxidoreductase subunit M|nr:NADH-quinone oxidoreductase subunit M [Chitinophagales bacterium]